MPHDTETPAPVRTTIREAFDINLATSDKADRGRGSCSRGGGGGVGEVEEARASWTAWMRRETARRSDWRAGALRRAERTGLSSG